MRAWIIASAGAALCVACGGNSSSDAPGGGGGSTGGGAGSAGASTGGSAGGAGASTGGGAGNAGASTGGSAGSAGTPGTGGAPTACYDPALKTCTGPAQCVLTSPNCCLCGMPEITDFVAMNGAHAQACTCEGPACGCATAINPNLAASCDATTAQCVGWDVRTTDAWSSCTADTDCRLRMGLGCCEPCTADLWGLVAIRSDATLALEQAVCAPGTACEECAPTYDEKARAQCVAGHCQVMLPI